MGITVFETNKNTGAKKTLSGCSHKNTKTHYRILKRVVVRNSQEIVPENFKYFYRPSVIFTHHHNNWKLLKYLFVWFWWLDKPIYLYANMSNFEDIVFSKSWKAVSVWGFKSNKKPFKLNSTWPTECDSVMLYNNCFLFILLDFSKSISAGKVVHR